MISKTLLNEDFDLIGFISDINTNYIINTSIKCMKFPTVTILSTLRKLIGIYCSFMWARNFQIRIGVKGQLFLSLKFVKTSPSAIHKVFVDSTGRFASLIHRVECGWKILQRTSSWSFKRFSYGEPVLLFNWRKFQRENDSNTN